MSYNPISQEVITALNGDVAATGTGGPATATVNAVGGKTASDVASATSEVEAATNSNVPGSLVIRDSSGNISANTVYANFDGNVTGNLTGNVTGHASADLALSGGTMTGPINMNSEGITNLPAGVNPGDATNVAQLQNVSILNALIFG